MADYDVVPKRLSISSVTGKALALSDISCKTTVFPPRRIFEVINDIAVAQFTPSITGVSIGGKVTGLKPVGGTGPVVITIVTGDDDDDNDDFDIDDYGNITWAVTPTTAKKKVRVRATDANGDYTEKAICLNDGNFGWSDPLSASSLNTTRWSILGASANYLEAFSASGINITKTAASTTAYYLVGQMPSFDDVFTQSIAFGGTYGVSTGSEFERMCGMRATIDGSEYFISAVQGEGTVLSPSDDVGVRVEGPSGELFAEILALTSGTLEISRNASNLVEFKVNGVVKHSLTKAGSVSSPRLGIVSSTNTQTPFESTVSSFVITKNGTPYVT